jgi:hypothetical protein
LRSIHADTILSVLGVENTPHFSFSKSLRCLFKTLGNTYKKCVKTAIQLLVKSTLIIPHHPTFNARQIGHPWRPPKNPFLGICLDTWLYSLFFDPFQLRSGGPSLLTSAKFAHSPFFRARR